jgi:hypothetical protein
MKKITRGIEKITTCLLQVNRYNRFKKEYKQLKKNILLKQLLIDNTNTSQNQ